MRRHPLSFFIALLLSLSLLSFGLVACGGDDEGDGDGDGAPTAEEADAEDSGATVAFIGVAPVTQGNWDPAGYQAFSAMAEKYGFEASNQESVGYDEAPSVLRRLAPENELVIAHSGGYEAAVLEVAPEFPETMFVVFPTTPHPEGPDWPDNVAGWALDNYEVGYLVGTAACLTAQSEGGEDIGWVNSVPIPAFTAYAGTAEAAAEDFGCGFHIRWTDSFEDVSRAKQAALNMISAGAEVIATSADTADAGSRDGVVEADKKLVALFVAEEVDLAPENTVTAVYFDFDGAYDEIGQLFSNGELEGQKYPFNVQNGGINYATPFMNVDESVEQEAMEVYDQIEDGSLEVPEREIQP